MHLQNELHSGTEQYWTASGQPKRHTASVTAGPARDARRPRERCSQACSKEALWQNFNVPLPSLRSLQSSVPRVRSAERRCCSPAACRHSWAPTCIRSSAPYATTSLKRWARTKSLRRENSDAVYKRICDKAFAISPRTYHRHRRLWVPVQDRDDERFYCSFDFQTAKLVRLDRTIQ